MCAEGFRSKLDSENPTKNDRSKTDRCPCCLDKLSRIGKGTRKQRTCNSCGSSLAKELKCSFCSKNEIWRGKNGKFCHNCGNEHGT